VASEVTPDGCDPRARRSGIVVAVAAVLFLVVVVISLFQ